jgi:hypothetical protein
VATLKSLSEIEILYVDDNMIDGSLPQNDRLDVVLAVVWLEKDVPGFRAKPIGEVGVTRHIADGSECVVELTVGLWVTVVAFTKRFHERVFDVEQSYLFVMSAKRAKSGI